MNRKNFSWTNGLVLVSLMALALLLRLIFWRLKPLDIDESFTLFIVGQPTFAKFLAMKATAGPQEPILSYLLEFAASRFTVDIGRLRLISLFFSVASVSVGYELGRKLQGRIFGLIWALLLCVSTFLIWQSQMFRFYSLVVFMTLCSYLYFFDFVQDKNRKVFSGVMAAYQFCYPYAILIAVSQVLYILWAEKGRRIKSLILHLIPMCVAFIVSSIPLLDGISAKGIHLFGLVYRPILPTIVDTAKDFSQGTITNSLIYAGLFVTGAISSLRTSTNRPRTSFALIAVAVTFPAIIGIEFVTNYTYYPAHAAAVIPLYLGIVAAGMSNIIEFFSHELRNSWPFRQSTQLVPVVVMLLLIGISISPIAAYGEKSGSIRGVIAAASDYVRERARDGDAVIFGNPNFGALLLYSWDKNALLKLRQIDLYRSFALFEFPKKMAVSVGSANVSIFTLCGMNPGLSTIDSKTFHNLLRRRGRGHRIWFVDMPFGYVYEDPEERFYHDLGVEQGKLKPEVYGVYTLTDDGPRA